MNRVTGKLKEDDGSKWGNSAKTLSGVISLLDLRDAPDTGVRQYLPEFIDAICKNHGRLVTGRTARRFALLYAWCVIESDPGRLPEKFNGRITAESTLQDFQPVEWDELERWARESSGAGYRVIVSKHSLDHKIYFSTAGDLFMETMQGERDVITGWKTSSKKKGITLDPEWKKAVKASPWYKGRCDQIFFALKYAMASELSKKVIGRQGAKHYELAMSSELSGYVTESLRTNRGLHGVFDVDLTIGQINTINGLLSQLHSKGVRTLDDELRQQIISQVFSEPPETFALPMQSCA